MSQIIKCPNCDAKSWSSDYWYCPSCNYYETKEETLLEMNQDYFDGKGRGDEPALSLDKWERDQKTLCQDMVDYLLPGYNLEPVSFNEPEDGEWGWTDYNENDQNKANQAKARFRENGGIEVIGSYLYYKWGVDRLIDYNQSPTKINISPKTLRTEQSFYTKYGVIGGGESPTGFMFYGSGAGFLPTTAHESAHASHDVKWDINFLPWVNFGHDGVWKSVYIKFFQKLQQRYGEEVKNRFIEYRKITGKEDNKYD